MVVLLMAFIAGLLTLAAPALAAPMADPTEPPPALREDAAGEAVRTPQLQSVLLPRRGKGVALIDGQQVALGGSLGDRRLVALSEREAVLEGPGGTERLRLTPEVEKVMLRPRRATERPAGPEADRR